MPKLKLTNAAHANIDKLRTDLKEKLISVVQNKFANKELNLSGYEFNTFALTQLKDALTPAISPIATVFKISLAISAQTLTGSTYHINRDEFNKIFQALLTKVKHISITLTHLERSDNLSRKTISETMRTYVESIPNQSMTTFEVKDDDGKVIFKFERAIENNQNNNQLSKSIQKASQLNFIPTPLTSLGLTENNNNNTANNQNNNSLSNSIQKASQLNFHFMPTSFDPSLLAENNNNNVVTTITQPTPTKIPKKDGFELQRATLTSNQVLSADFSRCKLSFDRLDAMRTSLNTRNTPLPKLILNFSQTFIGKKTDASEYEDRYVKAFISMLKKVETLEILQKEIKVLDGQNQILSFNVAGLIAKAKAAMRPNECVTKEIIINQTKLHESNVVQTTQAAQTAPQSTQSAEPELTPEEFALLIHELENGKRSVLNLFYVKPLSYSQLAQIRLALEKGRVVLEEITLKIPTTLSLNDSNFISRRPQYESGFIKLFSTLYQSGKHVNIAADSTHITILGHNAVTPSQASYHIQTMMLQAGPKDSMATSVKFMDISANQNSSLLASFNSNVVAAPINPSPALAQGTPTARLSDRSLFTNPSRMFASSQTNQGSNENNQAAAITSVNSTESNSEVISVRSSNAPLQAMAQQIDNELSKNTSSIFIREQNASDIHFRETSLEKSKEDVKQAALKAYLEASQNNHAHTYISEEFIRKNVIQPQVDKFRRSIDKTNPDNPNYKHHPNTYVQKTNVYSDNSPTNYDDWFITLTKTFADELKRLSEAQGISVGITKVTETKQTLKRLNPNDQPGSCVGGAYQTGLSKEAEQFLKEQKASSKAVKKQKTEAHSTQDISLQTPTPVPTVPNTPAQTTPSISTQNASRTSAQNAPGTSTASVVRVHPSSIFQPATAQQTETYQPNPTFDFINSLLRSGYKK